MGTADPVSWDNFGFAIISSITNSGNGPEDVEDDRCHRYTPIETPPEVYDSWKTILKRWGKYRNCVRQEKVRNLIFKGVPQSLRPELWRKMLDIPGLEASSSFSYEVNVQHLRDEMVHLGVTEYNVQKAEQILSNLKSEYCDNAKIDIKAIRQILLDVGRSYPTHKKFFVDNADGVEGRAMLFRILAVYTQYNPVTSYCQGMSYLGGILLMHLEEKEAFWAMVSLLERRKYLNGYYDCKLERVQGLAKVFHKVLERKAPKVAEHLESLNVDALLFLPKWILCLYTNLPCWDTVLTVWDLLLLEGSVVIFQVALAIIFEFSDQLLSISDVNQIIPLLQKVPHNVAQRQKLMPALKSVKFEGWEMLCLQAVIQEEMAKVPHTHQKDNLKGFSKKNKGHSSQAASSSSSSNPSIKSPPKSVLQRISWVLMGAASLSSNARKKKKGTVVTTHLAPPQDKENKEISIRSHQGHTPRPQMLGSPSPCSIVPLNGMRRGNVRKLVGSTASLQLAFRQFQAPLSRQPSPCRPPSITRTPQPQRQPPCRSLMVQFSGGSPLSPMEMTQIHNNNKRRSSRHRTRSSHCSVTRGHSRRSPSPLELRPLGTTRQKKPFLTP